MWKYWNVPKVDWGTYRDIRDTTEEIVDIMNARDEPEGIYNILMVYKLKCR